MANEKKSERAENIAVRLKGPALAAVDAEVKRLQREAPHFEPTRSDAVRSLIVRGAGALVAGGPAGRGAPRVRKGVALPEGSIDVGTGGPVAIKVEC